MAWVTPSSVATGDVLTAAMWNQDVVANWQAFSDAWTSWTPTWTNVTIGNATVEGKYVKVGRFVVARLYVKFGSTSSFGGAAFIASLPATAAAYNGGTYHFPGNASFVDAGTAVFTGYPRIITTTTFSFVVGVATGTYLTFSDVTSTVPYTFTTNDELHTFLVYEAASA